MRRIFFTSFIVLGITLAGLFAYVRIEDIPWKAIFAPPLPQSVSGKVVNADGPVAGALVQVMGRPDQVTTQADGTFTIQKLGGRGPATLTAWSAGHTIGSVVLDPGAKDWNAGQEFIITMKPHFTTDNNEYDWFSFDGIEGSASCGVCHWENDEWKKDAHSQTAVNPRFISIYKGTDVNGNEGQETVLGTDGLPLPPDPNLPYYGPGYRLDNPLRAGSCSTCHTPVAAKISNEKNCGWSGCHTDLTSERAGKLVDHGVLPIYLEGDAAEGISCEFCHKIGEVFLDPETGLPKADMPGILSYKLFRPEEDDQLFFGTLVDVPRRDTYLPLLGQSEYCAPCHYGVFGGVVGHGVVRGGTLIYNSYGEWLDSPYSDAETGKTCQQCHMPRSDREYMVSTKQGGVKRDYQPYHDHVMPGAADQEFLQNAVTMKSTAAREGNQLEVEINITNDNTGHHIPTDAPIREMILVVEAVDDSGKPLVLLEGPVLPTYSGDFAGQPGKSFAKIFKDEWSGEAPTAAYWRPVTIIEDTRLAALATDTTRYSFELPDGKTAKVNVRLLFRRAFYDLAKIKGLNDPDILMEEETIQVKR